MTNNRKSQEDRILNILEVYAPEWVPLNRILDLRIASYTRRISELRKRGHAVECQTERVGNETHSKYRLVR